MRWEYFDTQGLQFSINGLISRNTGVPKYEAEGRYKCKRFSDIKPKTVLIGDCAITGINMPARSMFYGQENWDNKNPRQIERIIIMRGPWPQIPFMGRYRVNYYGHTGEKINFAFTDGHVEPIKKLKARLFTLE